MACLTPKARKLAARRALKAVPAGDHCLVSRLRSIAHQAKREQAFDLYEAGLLDRFPAVLNAWVDQWDHEAHIEAERGAA